MENFTPNKLEDSRSRFGSFLYELRKNSNISISEITKNLGFKSPSSYISWEEGDSIPTEEKLPMLAEIFKLDLGDLKTEWKEAILERQKLKDARRSSGRSKVGHEHEGIGISSASSHFGFGGRSPKKNGV